MCFGGNKQKVSGQAPPPAIKPRLEVDDTLPTKKNLVDDDTKADISYGSTKKRAGPAEAKKTGAASLKIPLNTGTNKGSTTGGLNV
tara:strand:- start:3748 stop:4005 length:258 start_codon:yes stop_codon:yes gene_type:complete